MYVPTEYSDKPVKKFTGRWAYGKGKITTSNNLIKIAQWNVNGIRTSKGDVEKYIQKHSEDLPQYKHQYLGRLMTL
jgi:hypothetical protein